MSASGLDKRQLLEALRAQVEAKLEELRAGYTASRDAVLSSPHVMKSKREVFGQESAYLANALALNIQQRENELKSLRGVRLPEAPARAALGCVVGIGELGAEPEALYLLLPVCGGMEIPGIGGGPTVRVITPAAPVARLLLGKQLGDDVAIPSVPPRGTTVTLLE